MCWLIQPMEQGLIADFVVGIETGIVIGRKPTLRAEIALRVGDCERRWLDKSLQLSVAGNRGSNMASYVFRAAVAVFWAEVLDHDRD